MILCRITTHSNFAIGLLSPAYLNMLLHMVNVAVPQLRISCKAPQKSRGGHLCAHAPCHFSAYQSFYTCSSTCMSERYSTYQEIEHKYNIKKSRHWQLGAVMHIKYITAKLREGGGCQSMWPGTLTMQIPKYFFWKSSLQISNKEGNNLFLVLFFRLRETRCVLGKTVSIYLNT